MKVAIIGLEKRLEKDKPLVEEAKKTFKKFEYIPIEKIRFEILDENSIVFDGKKLDEFDFIFPIPTFNYLEFFYMVLRNLSDIQSTISASQLLLIYNKTYLKKILEKNGIKTCKLIALSSKDFYKEVLKEFRLPIIISSFSKKFIVNDRITLKNVLSLFKPNEFAYIERAVSSKNLIFGFFVDNEDFWYKKINGKRKKVEVNENLREIGFKIKKVLKLRYYFLIYDLKNECVKRISVSPDFSILSKIFKKEPIKKLVLSIKNDLESGRWVRLNLIKRIKRRFI